MKFRILFLLVMTFSLLFGPAYAKEKEKLVHQEADRLAYDDKLKIMRLFGHVKLWQEDSILVCDHAVYNLKTEEADAAGDLKMTNPDGTVVGDKLKVYYNRKVGIVEGHVTLVYVPPKKQKGKNRDNSPVTITCDELVYDWGRKVANANGNVLMEQKGKKAWGDHAIFEETPQRLTMDGKVKLFRPPKDTLLCDHLIYDLKIDHADATGHVVGTFLVKEKEAPSPSPSPTPQKSPGKGTKP